MYYYINFMLGKGWYIIRNPHFPRTRGVAGWQGDTYLNQQGKFEPFNGPRWDEGEYVFNSRRHAIQMLKRDGNKTKKQIIENYPRRHS